MVFKTGAKSRYVMTKAQCAAWSMKSKKSPDPRWNPPDFMGIWDGRPVGIDAKRSTSSETYYTTRKKRSQLRGICDMFDLCPNGLFGYVIRWGIVT